jgi:hypothetical protein
MSKGQIMPMSPSISSVLLPNGETLFYGREWMEIPDGGPSVRSCAFVLPELQTISATEAGVKCTPFVQVSIDSVSPVGGTGVLGIYGVQTAALDPGWCEIVIEAQTIGGNEVEGDYWCNITVIGTPA